MSEWKWNGSPFMPMAWRWNEKGATLYCSPYSEVCFIEYQDENGMKKHIAHGHFPDRDRTTFRYVRFDNFIQPSDIEEKYRDFQKKHERTLND